MLDGSNATPLIRDFTLGAAAAHYAGDLMTLKTDDGYVDQVTTTTTEVLGIMQESMASVDITAGTTKGKLAILTGNQVWRCSTNSTTTAATVGVTKVLDTADCRTIDEATLTGGKMLLVESTTADDGTGVYHVLFTDTTFMA